MWLVNTLRFVLLSDTMFNILFVWTETPLATSKSLGVDNDDVFHLLQLFISYYHLFPSNIQIILELVTCDRTLAFII